MLTLEDWSRFYLGRVTLGGFDADSAAHRRQSRELVLRIEKAGYTEHALGDLLARCPAQIMNSDYAEYLSDSVLPSGAIGDMARLLLLHRVLPQELVAGYLGDELLQFCFDHGLLRKVEGGVQSLVSGFWCCGLFVWTDAWLHAEVWPVEVRFPDRVMYVGPDSKGLACLVPSEETAGTTRALDLCTGSGVIALVAASRGMEVVGVDINPRAVRFASFNAAANDITGATFLLSDLYEALGDQCFSLILANPPFVPCPRDAEPLLYRDAGPRGEDILQRIIYGAPLHLAAGGAVLIVSDFVDLPSLAIRVQKWWGQRRSFVFILDEQHIPHVEYAAGQAAGVEPGQRSAAASCLHTHLMAADIQAIHFGYLVVAADVSVGNGSLVRQMAAPVVQPLHCTTQALLAIWHQVAEGIPGNAVLCACQGLVLSLKMRQAMNHSGKHDSAASVYVEDNPVLSAQDLCVDGFSLVSALLKGTLSWQEVCKRGWSSAAYDLLVAGFLRIDLPAG